MSTLFQVKYSTTVRIYKITLAGKTLEVTSMLIDNKSSTVNGVVVPLYTVLMVWCTI